MSSNLQQKDSGNDPFYTCTELPGEEGFEEKSHKQEKTRQTLNLPLLQNVINPSKCHGSHPSMQLCTLLINLLNLTALAADHQPKNQKRNRQNPTMFTTVLFCKPLN